MRQVFEKKMRESRNQASEAPWEDPEFYGNFLAQTYYFVCHSTRLLATAAGRLTTAEEPLFRRFAEHMAEEKAHERLAENDLKGLGYGLSEFRQNPFTRAFYESQYYKIEHQDPVALLGYILYLEGMAAQVGPLALKRIEKVHPKNACHFLKVHVEEDPDHVDKAFEQIAKMSSARQIYIEENLAQSAKLYSAMLSDIAQNSWGGSGTKPLNRTQAA